MVATRVVVLGVAVGFGLASLSLAVETQGRPGQIMLSPPGTDSWQPLRFPKIKRSTVYTAEPGDGFAAVHAVSDCAGSALYLPVQSIDLNRTPRLHWKWKIEKGLPVHNERVASGDEFAARVYVTFDFDAAHASLWQRLRHAVEARLYGSVVPGSAISYVWSTHEAAGNTWDNPYLSQEKMISLGSGPLPRWTEESVDVEADYRSLFGRNPPPLLAIAILTDSEDSCQLAIADFGDFSFTP
jgi:hypothetical protein